VAETTRWRLDPTLPDQGRVQEAIERLRHGALIVYPTDTLYAFGGAALLPGVAEAIRRAKQRERGKPLPLVASDAEQARGLCAAWPESAARLAERFWPGPLTVVVGASPAVPSAVTEGGLTVAVRVPGLALTRALCAGAGPLVSTSANRASEPPALDCDQALAALAGTVSLALDVGRLESRPSTIVDVSRGAPRVLREGAIAAAAVWAVLRPDGAPIE